MIVSVVISLVIYGIFSIPDEKKSKFGKWIPLLFIVSMSHAQITLPHVGAPIELTPGSKKMLSVTSNITYDTIKVPCIKIYADTSYQTTTSVSTVKVQLSHDSTYRSCKPFLWWSSCKTVKTKITHDSTYTISTTTTQQIIKADTVNAWCDSIITIPTTPTPKPRMKGLITRQFNWVSTKYADTSFIRSVPGAVIRPKLKDISPEEGVYDFTAIDTALVFADRMKALGLPYTFKIRLINGFPPWMKTKFGSFAVSACGYDSAGWDISDSTCVKWWVDGYMQAYQKIMDTMSKRYDNDERIQEIVIDATAFGTGEPFNLAISNAGCGLIRKNQYTAAGLTDSLRIDALYKSIDVMAVWKRTNFSVALNPFEHLPPKMATENETSKAIGEYMCKLYGVRAVLGNNGLRPASVDEDWQAPLGKMWDLETFYTQMKTLYGSGVYNQTASTKQMGGSQNIVPTFDYGLQFGIEYCEHPDIQRVFQGEISAADLVKYGLLFLH